MLKKLFGLLLLPSLALASGIYNPGSGTGGGGGSSSLQVTRSGVEITSPTASMNFSSLDFLLSAVGSTSTITLNPATTDFIHNQLTLQSGATAFPEYLFVSSRAVISPDSSKTNSFDGAVLTLGSTSSDGPLGIMLPTVFTRMKFFATGGQPTIRVEDSGNPSIGEILHIDGTQVRLLSNSNVLFSVANNSQIYANTLSNDGASMMRVADSASWANTFKSEATAKDGVIKKAFYADASGSSNADNIALYANAVNGGTGKAYGLYIPNGQTWFGSSVTVHGTSGLRSDFNVQAGSITGAGLADCGDATHALGYTTATGLFSCANVTGTGGGGSSSLAVTTGTPAGFNGPPTSSPTAIVVLNSAQFTGSLLATNTYFATINTSSITALGPDIDLSGAEATGILAGARFPALSGDVTTSAGSLVTSMATNITSTSTWRSSMTVAGVDGLRVYFGILGSTANFTAFNATTTSATVTGASGLNVVSLTASRPVLSDANKTLSSGQIDLSNTNHITGTLAAAQFPALTGDVTTTAGSLAASLGVNIVSTSTWRSSMTVAGVEGLRNRFGLITSTLMVSNIFDVSATSVSANSAVWLGIPGSAVTITSNVVTPGATFYQNGLIKTQLTPSRCIQTDASGNLSVAAGTCGTSSGYNLIQEEGSNLAAETTLNFIGSAVTCVDNAGSTRTDCTITGSTSLTVATGTTAGFNGPTLTGVNTVIFDSSTLKMQPISATTAYVTLSTFTISSYTFAGTFLYTVPTNPVPMAIDYWLCGAGGSGGGGAGAVAGSARGGGSGGGGGACRFGSVLVSTVGASFGVNVGTGAAGGAGGAVNNGTDGTAGTATSIFFVGGGTIAIVYGGGAGRGNQNNEGGGGTGGGWCGVGAIGGTGAATGGCPGGSNTNGAGGSGAGSNSSIDGRAADCGGGSGGSGRATTGGMPGGASSCGGGGGGGAAGCTTGNVCGNGANGGGNFTLSQSSGGAVSNSTGGTGPGNAGNGANGDWMRGGQGGGGTGGDTDTTNAATAGNGGYCGGGGGGGGGGTSTGGTAGKGGHGCAFFYPRLL